ncbi:MAG: tetratricopeptide repeat protein [Candidatus Coatesbacteria bacterium]
MSGASGGPLLAAVLAWNAFVLVFFLDHFWIGPSILANAARQYLFQPPFRSATLAANWAIFLPAAIACGGLLVAASTTGGALGRLLRTRADGVRTLALGLGALGTLTLGLGLAGLLVRPPAAVSGAVLAGLALAGIRRRRAIGAAIRAGSPGLPPLSPFGRTVLAAAVCLALAGTLNIEMSWDALTYHLRIPSFYAYRHKVFDVWHHYCAPFPSLVEMLYLVCQLTGGDLMARMLNAVFGLLLLGSLPRLVRLAGLGSSGFTAALLCGCPLFLLLLGRAYIDLGFALFLVLAVADLLEWRRGRDSGKAGYAIASGLLAGFGLSSKYVGALALPGFLAAAVAWPGRPRRFTKAAALWIVSAAAPLVPWLARNWINKANPVSPLLGGLFGTHEVIPGDVTPLFSLADPLRHLVASLPARAEALLVNHGRIDGPVAAAVTGLLPLLAFGGLAPAARPLAAFVLAYLAGWFVLSPDVRFLLPVLPILGLLAGDSFARIWGGAARGARVAARLLLEAQLVAGALYGTSVLWVFFDPLGMPLGLASVEERLQLGLPPAPFTWYMKTYVNANVPAGERIWFLTHPFTYYVDRECVADFHFGTSQFTRLARSAPTAGAMARRFRQLGVRWLLSTGGNATQYASIPGYYDVPAGVPEALKRLLATRSDAVWQTESFTLYRLGRAHPPRPLPALPIFEALAWERADRDLGDGRTGEALTAFLAPPALLADVGSTYVRQGDAWMTLGDAPRAEAAFRRALALGADQPRIRTGLAQALLRLGRAGQALEHSEAAWRESPLSAYAAAGLALNYHALGRTEDARRLIREAIRLRPDEPDYREFAKRLGLK